ncbi:MAG: AraC family transcriptional regulator [Clostridia bacterium]|nr:AraC family transcriptional regulator [Clostridia bacterium]
MPSFRYHEDRPRGSTDFPLDYHYIDSEHPRYEMPYHWHEEAEFVRVLSGRLTLLIDGQSRTLESGDALYISSGRLHGGRPENCVYECAVFDMRLLLQTNAHCRPLISNVQTCKVDILPHFALENSSAAGAIAAMFDALRSQQPGWSLMTLGCLMQFMGEAYRCSAYTQHDERQDHEARSVVKLKKVFELIESRLDDPPSLGELSACAGMSPKYFCRFFRTATRHTPTEYIGYLRIEQACHQIASTDKNVTEIAMDLGYSDVNYFIRCFRKYKNVTPKQYMLSVRQ